MNVNSNWTTATLMPAVITPWAHLNVSARKVSMGTAASAKVTIVTIFLASIFNIYLIPLSIQLGIGICEIKKSVKL